MNLATAISRSKNRLIILLLLFTTLQANAQKDDYIHLLDTAKVWVEAMRYEFGDIMTSDAWTGDTTTHNDTLYYELFDKNYGSLPYYLREDTIEKKVYYRQTFDYPEQLYYDFSLEVGDSIAGVNWPCMLYLDSIKNIDYFNNIRKTFYFHSDFHSWEFYPIWVEGTGSLAGILMQEKTPNLNMMGETELNCYSQNNELQYQSNFASTYGCHFEYLD